MGQEAIAVVLRRHEIIDDETAHLMGADESQVTYIVPGALTAVALLKLEKRITTLESRLREVEAERDEARHEVAAYRRRVERACAMLYQVGCTATVATPYRTIHHRVRQAVARLREVEAERDAAKAGEERGLTNNCRIIAKANIIKKEAQAAEERATSLALQLAEERADHERTCRIYEETRARLTRIEEAAGEAAHLLGIVIGYVEAVDAGYGQATWLRDARRVEATLRTALAAEEVRDA